MSEAHVLSAGGTVESPPAGPVRRVYLALEMAVLYGAVPIGLHFLMQAERIPIFFALIPVLAAIVVILLADSTFRLRDELWRGFSWLTLASILCLFAVGGGAAALWVKQTHPSWFLEFPTNRPEIYKRVVLLYPLFSVLTQEIVYRTFYFHRYGPLFGEQQWLGIVTNGLLFGFAHIVVGSTVAVITTLFGGILLALRYSATRSFWAVFVEHTLWGWLIFTIGLGRFFFTGVPSIK
ncbi:MAG: CPBP family intramembrane glutamic endopeptidase [Hyphomicrobium sp.]